MDIVPSDWSTRHKKLQKVIRKRECFTDAVDLALKLHAEIHMSCVGGGKGENLIDALFKDLQPREYAVMPTSKDETIAWAVWHIARIEDLTMNILVAGGRQVFGELWKQRMRVTVTDTGNAMTDGEIMDFSKRININELLNYRNAVGTRSRDILRGLKPEDMKRQIRHEDTTRILDEGGVTRQKDSVWLLDFWGRKDVAGIILMPLTRHQTLHLNDCDKWKKAICMKKKSFLE